MTHTLTNLSCNSSMATRIRLTWVFDDPDHMCVRKLEAGSFTILCTFISLQTLNRDAIDVDAGSQCDLCQPGGFRDETNPGQSAKIGTHKRIRFSALYPQYYLEYRYSCSKIEYFASLILKFKFLAAEAEQNN